MRIIHLADTHLGFRQFAGKLHPERRLNQRECDVYDAWHRAIDIAVDRQVDAVVHAGDLFDSPRPSPRAIAEALDGFTRLRDAGIPVIAIAGNHSTPRFRSGGSVFEVLDRFGIHTAWEHPRTIRIGDVAFHAVPHEPDAATLRADIESLVPDATATANVLIVHTGMQALPRSTYAEINQIELDPEVLAQAPFDYIALGDIHRHQVPQINAAYPGSLERLDFNDLSSDKVVLEVDLAAGAGHEDFLIRHSLSPRAMLDVGVDCADCDPGEVLRRIETELTGKALEGAVVRVRLTALQRDVYQALDFGRLEALLEPCLHHLLSVGHGLQTTAELDGSEQSFGAFARPRVPGNLDAERVIAIAESFLNEAAAEEAEKESAE